ncbi:hypothetical protein TSTA_012900 [Talaromyces stipitatus ATCC 10500]|uniref:Uncharacterized protein n=1 Tax=Talaromyces stipitatus (strain ATCC 10500 / CBS 375.48 / QM 6759 / NRRL 1006) TaxID=441959 RepID=B8MF84_TALSN|nr:uncharacterized protein TSTA_012900 [Talaromyces stipitatus ATCC 10500]EED16183.1 hypothetical protein TSTA_012900 [Talaromyces stipitatus ATCC 10500]
MSLYFQLRCYDKAVKKAVDEVLESTVEKAVKMALNKALGSTVDRVPSSAYGTSPAASQMELG